MALITSRREIGWFDRYWVQPGEVVVKLDGGQTRDDFGTPNIYRAGNLVKAKIRIFAQRRRQEIIIFDARRQPEPVRIVDHAFPLALSGLSLRLTATVWYRLRDPLLLLEERDLSNEQQVQQAILLRVQSLIEQVLLSMPADVFFGTPQLLQERLLHHPDLAQGAVGVEDLILTNVLIPPELAELRHALEAHFAQNRGAVEALLAQDIVPTFDYMEREFPSYVRELLVIAAELQERIIGPQPSPSTGGGPAAFVAATWNLWIREVQQPPEPDERGPVGVTFTNTRSPEHQAAAETSTTPMP